VRIERHTSSEWAGAVGPADAYARNMALSQERTRAVLEHWPGLALPAERTEWVRRHAAADGLASSRAVRRSDGSEDRDRSRQVEFRVATRARGRVLRIFEEIE